MELPPLPTIDNPRYADIVFSHSSANQRQRSSGSLDTVAGDADLDNEKLEHIGDSLLGDFVRDMNVEKPLTRPKASVSLCF